MNYLKGRENDTLWVMFRSAELVNEFEREGEAVRSYRYMDGKNPVLFVETNGYVKVTQPGMCLVTRCYQTNESHTKWELM